jgi:uncharacterized protein
MKIVVKAKPGAKEGAKEEKVERVTQPSLGFEALDEPVIYKVSVKEPPINGLANEAVTKALAKHFGVSPSTVKLIKGAKSKQKIFEI